MTPLQARMARAAVHRTMREVAAATGLSLPTVYRFEKYGDGGAAVLKLQVYYEAHGIVFELYPATADKPAREGVSLFHFDAGGFHA